jgi:predicted AlkP superfamily phosphohydrolase/phosphomutase
MNRMVIIGLDGVPPSLLFGPWLAELPNLRRLVARSGHGPLRSTIPPITVPAWAAMMSSQDPGMIGLYGFRNRRDHSYAPLSTATSQQLRVKMLWDYLAQRRMRSLVWAVPPGYPPRPINGVFVSCFLTPSLDSTFAHPACECSEIVERAGGDYQFDVAGFRTDDREQLAERITAMTRSRFRAFRHYWARERAELSILIEIGPDRIHHAFWRYHATDHRLHEPGHRYEPVTLAYYRVLDEEIGRLLDCLDGETSVLLVSDHGAKTMKGAVCVNEWLIREGYLVLRERPSSPTRLTPEMVDWRATRVWAEGGYYGRIFFNVEGREPHGRVPVGDIPALRAELERAMGAIKDERGEPIGVELHLPESTYRERRGVPPEMLLYLGGLGWRASSTVGGSVTTHDNDTGPDDANHSEEGVLVWDALPAGPVRGATLYDIAPSVLGWFGLEPPGEMIGRRLNLQQEAIG